MLNKLHLCSVHHFIQHLYICEIINIIKYNIHHSNCNNEYQNEKQLKNSLLSTVV